ncbi:MAG: hypothetical protein LBL44_04240 [Treponema sp.]|nr:hypothetical protein [Treponema sp.]
MKIGSVITPDPGGDMRGEVVITQKAPGKGKAAPCVAVSFGKSAQGKDPLLLREKAGGGAGEQYDTEQIQLRSAGQARNIPPVF